MDTSVAAAIAAARPIVRRRARRAGLSEQDAEDLLQTVVVTHLTTWRDGAVPDNAAPDNLGAWLERVTANAVADHQRAAVRRPVDLGGDDEDPVGRALQALRSPRFASLPPVRAGVIDAVFDLIPPAQADLLRRRYLDGWRAADVADDLGINVATADQRTARARRSLREALAARPDLVSELHAGHPAVY